MISSRLHVYWKKIGAAGLHPGLRPQLAKRISVTNQLSLTIFFVTAPYILLFHLAGAHVYGNIVIYIAGAYLGFIWLNQKRRYDLSRMWLIVHFNLAVLAYSSIFGEASGIHLCFFTLICLPLALFELSDRRKITVGMLLPCVCYLILVTTDFSIFPSFPLTPFTAQVIHFAIIVSNFVMIAAAFGHFYLTNERSEAALLKERDFTGAVVDTIGAIVVVIDLKGTIIRVNEATQRIMGYSAEEVVGRNYADLFLTSEERPGVESVIQGTFTGNIPTRYENHWRTKAGSLRRISWTNTALLGPGGETQFLVGTGIDITEQVNAQLLVEEQRAKLVVASKMSALGEMASGIAHEVNNPLAAIQIMSGHLQLLAKEGQADQQKLAEFAERIDLMVERISRIIQSLRSFAREGSEDPFVEVSTQAIIDDVLSFCRERFKNHRIKLEVSAPAEPLLVRCRNVQIAQVLLNLLTNAFDAVEELSGERRIGIEVKFAGENIILSVTDNGEGIPMDLRERIFAPFFTTKPVGKGTGLGLSISRSLIEAHQGSLVLDAGDGKGPEKSLTRFVITLPYASKVALGFRNA